MSQDLYARKPSVGMVLDDELKYILEKRGLPTRIDAGSKAFFQGLNAAGVKGADKVLELIDGLSDNYEDYIELYLR